MSVILLLFCYQMEFVNMTIFVEDGFLELFFFIELCLILIPLTVKSALKKPPQATKSPGLPDKSITMTGPRTYPLPGSDEQRVSQSKFSLSVVDHFQYL